MLICIAVSTLAQVPQGFNYQAVIRNSEGQLISDQAVTMRLTLQDQGGKANHYAELHFLTTSDKGIVNLVVGSGIPILNNFTDIPWEEGEIYLKVEVDPAGGTNFLSLGTTRLQSVPYALHAHSASSFVAESGVGGDEPLFVVRNSEDQIVFAVYEKGVRMYVEDDVVPEGKGNKSGFAIGGLTGNKQNDTEYFRVTPDSVRIFLREPTQKGNKGGFAIGGLTGFKADTVALMFVAPDSTRFYIDTEISGKGNKSGFAIGGLTGFKSGTHVNYLNVSADTTATIDPSEARILWYPTKNAFLAGQVLIEDPDSVGTNSTATGFESKAVGNFSQALGYQAIARGDYSTAIGKNALAQNTNSFAFGDGAKAYNQDSYAFGAFTEAQGLGSFAFGYVGRDSLGPTGTVTKALGNYSFAFGLGAQTGSTAEGAFAIGSGTSAQGEFSLAMGYKSIATDYYSIAIGWNAKAYLGSLAIGTGANGYGSGSIAIKGNAFGTGAKTMGDYSRADGDYSIAIGGFRDYLPFYPFTVFYYSTKAGGIRSIAIGTGVGAIGDRSISIGTGSLIMFTMDPVRGMANGEASVAFGYSNNADGDYSFALGNVNDATGDNSFALGNYTKSNGKYATAMGYYTTAQAYNSFVIGRYNILEGTTDLWTGADPLFIIGNGSSTSSRANAFKVCQNGFIEASGTLRITGSTVPPIGEGIELAYVVGNGFLQAIDRSTSTSKPLYIFSARINPITDNTYSCGHNDFRWSIVYSAGSVSTTSDLRKKDNITPISGGLETVLDLNPVFFTWKDKSDSKRHIGLIAQEVIRLVPEVVDTGDDENSTMGINYSGLVPVLVKAIQEQQMQIDKLQKENNELQSLKSEIEAIKAIIGK